jgi:phenylacetate-CoA ligase
MGFWAPPVLEKITESQLREYQLEQLKKTLRLAYASVPFYREKFDSAGFSPEKFKSLDDLASVPLLTKSEVNDLYPLGLLAQSRNQIARIHASSGTTGTPILAAYTAKDLETWGELMARCLHYAGIKKNSTVLITHTYGLFTGGLGVHYGAERLGCTVIPTSAGRTSLQARLIKDLQAEVLVGTPSYMLRIADEIERQKIDINGDLKLQICICGAEPWSEKLREEIEERLGVSAFDLYGLTEAIGPGVASEHREKKGQLVVWEDQFFPEVIEGELILTTLTKEAMPLVRFRTGDRTDFCKNSILPFRSIERISGRTDDMIKIRGIGVYPAQVEALLFQDGGFSGHYQMELYQKDRMDHLRILIENAPSRVEENLRKKMEETLLSGIGLKIEIVFCSPGTLERPGQKTLRIKDLREIESRG